MSIEIICADYRHCEAIAPAGVNLIVTSPPYNAGIDYADSADSLSYAEYAEFSKARHRGRY